MVLAVLLVVFIIPWPDVITNTYPDFLPDYPSSGDVLHYWLVAGLASLMIALVVKKGEPIS